MIMIIISGPDAVRERLRPRPRPRPRRDSMRLGGPDRSYCRFTTLVPGLPFLPSLVLVR